MIPKWLYRPLFDENRGTAYAIVFGIWMMVAIYSIGHDQYIVGIAPQHFTVYHAPIGQLRAPRVLAAAWALKASLMPGFLLGFATLAAARHGSWPKIRYRTIFLGVGCVIVLSEIGSAAAGFWVHLTGHGIYPTSFYPGRDHPMLVTQTIQITCYLASAAFSSAWLLTLFIIRDRQR